MAYTDSEQKKIENQTIDYANKLNLKQRQSGRILTETDKEANKSRASDAAKAYVESVDINRFLKSPELTNPETGSTHIQIGDLIDVGGQGCIFELQVVDFDSINPGPFHQSILQHRLREIDCASLDDVREEYSETAARIIKRELEGPRGRELVLTKLKPLLSHKLRDGKGILRINRGGDDIYSAKKARRVRSLDGLVHENIVYSALSAKNTDGRDFQIMERIYDIVPPLTIYQDLTQEEQISIIMQTALGLRMIADVGAIHRDIKPENVLVTKRDSKYSKPEVKIADFGLVDLTERRNPGNDSVTAANIRPGTVRFASPEHFQFGCKLDIRADICSLGLTAYSWITGEYAIAGETFEVQMANAQTREVKPKRIIEVSNPVRYRGIPAYHFRERGTLAFRYQELEKVVAKMIHLDRDRRYKDPHDVVHDLDNVLVGKKAELADIDIYEVFR